MNDVQKELQLTAKQLQVLIHRLDVPEAIAEAITDDTMDTYHPADVIYVAELLSAGDWDGATCHGPGIRDAVLEEAVEGGTWLAAIERHTLANLQIARTLAKRISQHLGHDVYYPEA